MISSAKGCFVVIMFFRSAFMFSTLTLYVCVCTRPSVWRPGEARGSCSSGGDEGGDGHFHRQGSPPCRRELWIWRRDPQEDQRLGKPTAGLQPLGGIRCSLLMWRACVLVCVRAQVS